jgi:E3 ubiquitin-protein ligase HECTD1
MCSLLYSDTAPCCVVGVYKVHASRKSVLDIEFNGEQGTGLGPSLEFYNLVASELQRTDLGMWVCDDDVADTADVTGVPDADSSVPTASADIVDDEPLSPPLGEEDVEDPTKVPGYYVRRIGGLFPAPLPKSAPHFHEIVERFRFLGIFVAKALQDSRLIDLPLSLPMLKLVCGLSLSATDLTAVSPEKGKFLAGLCELCRQKDDVLADLGVATKAERTEALAGLGLPYGPDGAAVPLDALGMDFVFSPASTAHGFMEHELMPGGSDIMLTIDNVEE